MKENTGSQGSFPEKNRGTDNLYQMLLEDIGKIPLAYVRFSRMSGYSSPWCTNGIYPLRQEKFFGDIWVQVCHLDEAEFIADPLAE